MKKFTWLVFAVLSVAFVSMLPSAASAFDGGDGTPGNPYQISNCVQLQEMNNNLNASYILMNDIDCTDTVNWNAGAGFVPIGTQASPFTGTFDGQDHKITGLFINGSSTVYAGLIGYVWSGAIISNVSLVDANITGYYCGYSGAVGGLVGKNYGSITNSNSTGSVASSYSVTIFEWLSYDVGGLVGSNEGTIKNSYSTGTIIGSSRYCSASVGGLIGANIGGGNVASSYSTASVTVIGYFWSFVGGLVGTNSGTILSSYATGPSDSGYDVGGLVGANYGNIIQSFATGTARGSGYGIGGLVGWNYGSITNSYATGNATGLGYYIEVVGGLVGRMSGTLTNSYSTGRVASSYTFGGLVGSVDSGTSIINSYWDTETAGQSTSAGGTGKTTAEMKQQATFVAWDFANVWAIEEAVSYPYFFWQANLVLGPAKMWIGLKNSDDVGTKFDLLAQVLKNDVVVGSGELDDVNGGSSGFNKAIKRTIDLALSGSPIIQPGDTLRFRLSVRISSTSGHRGGTARLWFNDGQANSSFDATIGVVNKTYYLLTGFGLGLSAGPGPKKYIDVSVDRLVGGNPFKPFGTWNKTF